MDRLVMFMLEQMCTEGSPHFNAKCAEVFAKEKAAAAANKAKPKSKAAKAKGKASDPKKKASGKNKPKAMMSDKDDDLSDLGGQEEPESDWDGSDS
eukprot:1743861-Lingulodinium_polyedra.AAC.1